MPFYKVDTFGGMIPVSDPQLLPEQYAALAKNCWLVHGTLIGLPTAHDLHTCASNAILGVYRLPASYNAPAYMYGSSYLEFTDRNTQVIHAPVFGDTFDRYYWANTIDVPRYNTRARIDAGNTGANAPLKLGINPPGVAPGVTPAGGVGLATSRAYVYTWVTAYGEESAPSPATVHNGKIDDTWALTFTAALAADIGGGVGADRNLSKTRIYRTVTDSSGTATYYLVAEIPIATLSYNDTALDATITGNVILPSTDWAPPPVDLQGWVLLPNGSIAAFRNNEVWFSEPYRPHAWPAKYVQTTEYQIVGLGTTAQTLVVCTKGYPVAMYGVTPLTMAISKLTNFEPCTARLSIISAPEGVYYMSPNGLMLVTGGQAQNITASTISKDKWNALTNFSALFAGRFGATYYAPGAAASKTFEPTAFDTSSFSQLDYSAALSGLIIDPTDQRGAIVQITSDLPIDSVQTDPWSGELLYLKNGHVYWLDTAYAVTSFVPYVWRSKEFRLGKPQNMGAIVAYFRQPIGLPVLNPVPNTALVQTLAADQWGLLRIYADGVLVFTAELRTSGTILRPPNGFKAQIWQFEIEARVEVTQVQFADTVKRLQLDTEWAVHQVAN